MIDMILAHPHLFWLSLGGLLLAAEMLGGSGYLLWSGVAGVVTGALTWLLPLSWEWQGTLFAVLTLLAAWLWSKWLRKRVKLQRPCRCSTQPARAAADRPPFDAGCPAGKRPRPRARGRQLMAGDG